MSIFCPKLTNMDDFAEQFKEFLDTTYNISISREFIEYVLKNNIEINIELSHITFKESNNGFNYINTLFNNIFGTPLKKLVYMSIEFEKNKTQENDALSILNEKIKKLEKHLEDSKETIDELRDSYVRVKRENDRIRSNNNLRTF